jgi:hypothetical protein
MRAESVRRPRRAAAGRTRSVNASPLPFPTTEPGAGERPLPHGRSTVSSVYPSKDGEVASAALSERRNIPARDSSKTLRA